jgi:hypothetical protein
MDQRMKNDLDNYITGHYGEVNSRIRTTTPTIFQLSGGKIA